MNQENYYDTLEKTTKAIKPLPDGEEIKHHFTLLNIAESLLSEYDRLQTTMQELKTERDALLLKKKKLEQQIKNVHE